MTLTLRHRKDQQISIACLSIVINVFFNPFSGTICLVWFQGTCVIRADNICIKLDFDHKFFCMFWLITFSFKSMGRIPTVSKLTFSQQFDNDHHTNRHEPSISKNVTKYYHYHHHHKNHHRLSFSSLSTTFSLTHIKHNGMHCMIAQIDQRL